MLEVPLSRGHVGDCELLIASQPSKSHVLNQFRGIVVNQLVLMSSECLDSDEKCREVLELGQGICSQISKNEIKKPLRVASVQLSSIAYEWDIVQEQHRRLLKFTAGHSSEFQIAHFCFPMEDARFHHDETFSDFDKKSMLQLLKLFNAEGCLVYCRWLNQECERVVRTFYPEDSEEYQLQALLEDFSHEVRSPLLIDRQQAIVNAMIEEEKIIEAGRTEGLLDLEKRAVSARMELLSDLQVQNDLLKLIVEGIQKIEGMHPELLPLKRQAMLLNQVILHHFSLNDWSREKQLLMMQLLDEQLEVLPIICCGAGVERTENAFSLRLALAEMKKAYSFDVLLKMCMEWDLQSEKESGIQQELHEWMRSNRRFWK